MKVENVFLVSIVLCCIVLAFPANAADYGENFNSYAPGADPTGWLDTGASNGLTEVDNFKVQSLGGEMVLTTASVAVNIHSHYIGAGSLSWTNYVLQGRMMLDNNEGGIGVTFFSDYNNSDSYYRLRSEQGGTFHISPHGTSISGGTIDSGIAPTEGTWYLFMIEAEDTGTRSEIRAKIWAAGSSEPTSWQIDCYDSNPGRLTAGRVGVWCMRYGNKYWDDFVVTGVAPITGVLEDFEAGYTDGNPIRLHPDWFTEATRTDPTTENNVGIGGTWGLSPGNPIFTWVAYPFSWASDLAVGDTVTMSMDFQADSLGLLDDDRVGWMISDSDDSSDLTFSVQIDPEGSNLRLEGYWDHVISVDKDKRPVIDEIAGTLTAGAWYRLQADFTKLTATSCAIAASVTPLDGSGNPSGAAVLSGSIADTSLIAGGEDPDPAYFTATTIWPAYKNYNCTNCDGGADNAFFGISAVTPQTYTLTVNTIGSGTVTCDPDQAEYNFMDAVQMTANPASGWQFSGWSGDYTGSDNPCSIDITANMVITATFTEITPVTGVLEDFETGYTGGNPIRLHPDWFTEDTRTDPTIENNVGIGGTWGISPGNPIFTWVAYPFSWASDLAVGDTVTMSMDFQADSLGLLDDDRVGWMISDSDDSSDLTFSVQIDPEGSNLRLEGYWDHVISVDKDKRPVIDEIAGTLTAGAWYRLQADFTKLTATSCAIAASVTPLDGSGNLSGAAVLSGSIADTSLIAGGEDPDPAYFTATTIWPAYKNYNCTNCNGGADNAFFGISAGTPQTYTLTVNTVGSGTVTVNPDKAEYGYMEAVQLTANPASGWQFSGWSGDYTGSDNPCSVNMIANMVITATFTVIPQLPQNWTAYNDCVYDPTQLGVATNPNGQLVHYKVDNVTTFNIGNNSPGPASGELVDFSTGLGTGITATLTTNAGVVWQPDASSSWYGGYDTALGTDARNTFGGIADMTGVIYYASSAGWYVDLALAGLDPSKNYLFATSAARCSASYTNRISIYTISGVDSATNASTAGVSVLSETQVSFNTGDNYNEGYVARWTNINPGADGSFTVRATHSATAESGYKAYAFDVFMLQAAADPHKARNPSPGDMATDVGAAPILSWTPGIAAAWHQIYFGTDFDDVNDANTTVTLGVYQGEKILDANYFDPGILDYSQAYYWRIDEVNDSNAWKGDVWKFTTVTPVCVTPPPCDINGDCVVDIWDLQTVAGEWLVVGTPGETTPIEYVITISVDGLHSGYLQSIIDADNAPNFKRFQTEGAFTNNARTDYDITVTLPNHACMITGRAVYGTEGHGVSFNSDNGGTFETAHGSYVASAFDVVHDNSLRTGLYASKSKFDFYDRSYNAANGAADVTGLDDGTDKIDVYVNNSDTAALTTAFVAAMQADSFNLSLVCFKDADAAGEDYGWGSVEWNNSVIDIDGYLGSIFNLVENNPTFSGKTAILLTGDHGGVGTGHSDATNPNNYTVPFYVWAPGIPAGTDIYELAVSKTDPGTGRPTYSDPNQPIRNGNILNLALTLLGFDSIPGSTIDDMDLGIYASPAAFLEDFENSVDFPNGSNISDSAEWFSVDNSAGDQVKITDTGGVAGSRGLTNGDQIFIWTAHPFKWSAVNLQAVMVEFDVKTDGSGVLDDDRAGWMLSDSDTNSDLIFGVQVDPEGSNTRLEGYWDHTINVDEDKRPVIDELAGSLSPDTWYRLSATFTKLSDASARVEASLTELDSSGDPVVAPVLSGTIADTSVLSGGDDPDAAYFTADTLWPAYKNYDAVAGEADNAYFAVIANESCTPPMAGDFDGDCRVDCMDMAYLANEWMLCNLTPAGACP